MALTEDQILNNEEAFRTFKAATGAFAPYATDAVLAGNVEILAGWMNLNLPRGINSASEVGAWQLAFKNTVKLLTRDPSYVRSVSYDERFALFERFYAALASDQVRALYEGNIEQHYRPLSDLQKQQLTQLGGVAIFKRFVDEGK